MSIAKVDVEMALRIKELLYEDQRHDSGCEETFGTHELRGGKLRVVNADDASNGTS